MTIILIIAISITSIIAFSNHNLFQKLLFNPYKVYHNKEYYRFITHAFLHADWLHLIVNMFVMYSFGTALEYYLKYLEANNVILINSTLCYLILFFTSVVVSSLITFKKYRETYWYNSVGASGAVSAILFCCIFLNPLEKILFWGILPIPGLLFGVIYLFYSHYMSKKGNDNINHEAHFMGAVYGFGYLILFNPKLFYGFINELTSIIK